MNTTNYCEPYKRIQSYVTLPDADKLLSNILDYLIDMPARNHVPFESNECPRARIARYLYWDCSNPLSMPLPTPEQKKKLRYDPENPADPPDKERGYRIFPLITVAQAQQEAQTRLYAFMGQTTATSDFRADVSLVFRVLCSNAYDTNTKETALSRSWAIICAIVEALNGVNFGVGVGTIYFNRRENSECGIRFITDDLHNVGYQLVMGMTIMGEKPSNEPMI